MPELLWKSYIDFEIEEGERDRARALYERLIERSGHVKVWISYALFEASPIRAISVEDEDEEENVSTTPGDPERARAVFDRGYKLLKEDSGKANERGLDEEVTRLKEAVRFVVTWMMRKQILIINSP